MTTRAPFLSASLILITILSLHAADEANKPVVPDDSLAHVIQSDEFELAENLGDTSEAGQNHAARLLAAARRIKTEVRVSAKSMQRVLILDSWREALNRWDDLKLEIVLLQSGGGTMWSHMMQRNDAETEKFLAGIADHLPLEGADLTPETALAVDGMLTEAKKRLARAKKDATEIGLKPERQAADLLRRLEDTHGLLKWQFRFAGDATFAKRLLDRCREAASAWKEINDEAQP